jgi:hypothetical protein
MERNNNRVIISRGYYDMNFIDWNNEWERIAEVESMLERGEINEENEEIKRIKYFRDKEREKFGVKKTFPIIKADIVIIKKECYICLKNFIRNSKVMKLPCSHMFCEKCISPWLKHNFYCPTCKFNLKGEEFEEY